MFLERVDGGSAITLSANTDPTLVTIAHGSSNYLVEERASVTRAWTNFTVGKDYWLYIDIDMVTGRRSFGHTTLAPTFGPTAPTTPATEQHWFDTNAHTMCMKVFNGKNFVKCLRVFLAKYQAGSILVPMGYGSQVNINRPNDAGHILFDSEGQPARKAVSNNSYEFFTTTSVFATATSKSVNVTLDAVCSVIQASESIPEFSLVTYGEDPSTIVLADASTVTKPAVGIVQEEFYNGEVGIFSTAGFIHNEMWNWTERPGTQLFLNDNGKFTSNPPRYHTVQCIGYVVNARTIKLDIQPPVHYDISVNTGFTNLVPVLIDRTTGKYVATTIDPASGQLADNEYKAGYTYPQSTAATTWVVHHNRKSIRFVAQVFDTASNMVMPESIKPLSSDIIEIKFAAPQAGFVNIVFFDATVIQPFYDVTASVSSIIDANETLIIHPAPSTSTLDATGSFAYAKNSDNAELPIKVDGEQIGIIRFVEGEHIGQIIVTDTISITPNQIIEIAAPAVNTLLDTVGIRLRFTNTGD